MRGSAMAISFFAAVACAGTVGLWSPPAVAGPAATRVDDPDALRPASVRMLRQRKLSDREAVQPLATQALSPCTGGMAAGYPCNGIDLLSFMPLGSIGGGSGNDVWGWTDPETQREYALMGRTNGTAFVDVTDPENPVYMGNLPPHGGNSTWRDIKTWANHAYIVSEASGHGMQVFDLTQLRDVTNPPVQFSETAHYPGFGNAHNLVLNDQSGFAYGVGTNTCSGGSHIVDIMNPVAPVGVACIGDDGYTHDGQCVNYVGPDPDYQGAEICLSANEDTVTIHDVSDKNNVVQVAREGYPGDGYTHQGWLTEDHRYYLLDDELDESFFGHNTRTRIFDVSDLDNPTLIGVHDGLTGAIDHNQYVHEGRVYQANYRSGLRVLDLSNIASGSLSEIGFFDIYPQNDSASFNGAWSVYPFFASGTILISGMEQGLFAVRLGTSAPAPTLGNAVPGSAGAVNQWALSGGSAGGTVILFGGGQAGSTAVPLPACPGLTVAIANARALNSQTADALGDATFSRSMPAGLAGRSLHFQAVDRDTCTASNKVVDTFQ